MVPGAPTGVSATAGPGQATISWTAPASDGGSAITGYDVTPYIGGVAQSASSVGVVTQATIQGLTNGTTYTFRVAATNDVGTGPESADSNAVTPQKLNQTISVSTHAPASATFGTSFTVAATALGGAVSLLELGRVLELGRHVHDDERDGHVLGEVRPGRGRRRTTRRRRWSSPSQRRRPCRVSRRGVTATSATGEATVNWTAPASNGGSAITGYDVTTYVAGVLQSTKSVGLVTQTTVTGLTNGTTYTFRVAAKNIAGTGPESADSNPVTPGKLNQTITVGTHAPASAAFGASFTVAATASPGSAVSYSSSGACSNTGATFTMTSATGTCSVKYDQAGDATYNAAPQVVEVVNAQKADQTIAVSTHAPASAIFGVELLGCGDRPGRRGDVLERGCLLELGGDVHDDERDGDVLGEVRPGRQRELQRGSAGRRGRERAEGQPDDHRLDARAGEAPSSERASRSRRPRPAGAVASRARVPARTRGRRSR